MCKDKIIYAFSLDPIAMNENNVCLSRVSSVAPRKGQRCVDKSYVIIYGAEKKIKLKTTTGAKDFFRGPDTTSVTNKKSYCYIGELALDFNNRKHILLSVHFSLWYIVSHEVLFAVHIQGVSRILRKISKHLPTPLECTKAYRYL